MIQGLPPNRSLTKQGYREPKKVGKHCFRLYFLKRGKISIFIHNILNTKFREKVSKTKGNNNVAITDIVISPALSLLGRITYDT